MQVHLHHNRLQKTTMMTMKRDRLEQVMLVMKRDRSLSNAVQEFQSLSLICIVILERIPNWR